MSNDTHTIGLTKCIDTPRMAIAFLSDVLRTTTRLVDDAPHDACTVRVEITVGPPSDDDTLPETEDFPA